MENVDKGEYSSSFEFLSTLVKCIINISNESGYIFIYLYINSRIHCIYPVYMCYDLCCSLYTDNASSISLKIIMRVI